MFPLLSFVIIGTAIGSIAFICIGGYRASGFADITQESKRKARGIAGLLLAGWFILSLWLGMCGFFSDSVIVSVPNIVFGVFIPLVIGLCFLIFSATFRKVVRAVPQQWLVGIQFYRVLGIIFVLLFAHERLPAVFALPAGLGDFLVGITAPLVAYWYRKQWRRAWGAVVAWNIVGILDLIIALFTGFFAAPTVFRIFFVEPTTEALSLFPLVLIPVFAVPMGLLLHAISLYKLKQGMKI